MGHCLEERILRKLNLQYRVGTHIINANYSP
jgi:hypothetical protein